MSTFDDIKDHSKSGLFVTENTGEFPFHTLTK